MKFFKCLFSRLKRNRKTRDEIPAMSTEPFFGVFIESFDFTTLSAWRKLVNGTSKSRGNFDDLFFYCYSAMHCLKRTLQPDIVNVICILCCRLHFALDCQYSFYNVISHQLIEISQEEATDDRGVYRRNNC